MRLSRVYLSLFDHLCLIYACLKKTNMTAAHMTFTDRVITQLALFAALLSSGCSHELDLHGGSGKLVGGERSDERPEVGYLTLAGGNRCTGTLIAPSVFITAAHCALFKSEKGDLGTFTLRQAERYQIDEVWSLSDAVGNEDIALMHLATPVPPQVARPAKLAAFDSKRGAEMTIYGFGCQNREDAELGAAPEKQRVRFNYGEQVQHLCPGDSGGPVFADLSGHLVLLNSAYYIESGDDIFASPFAYHDRLLEVAYLLEKGEAVEMALNEGTGSPTDEVTPSPSVELGDSCAEFGYYQDDFCDVHCPMPDPACEAR